MKIAALITGLSLLFISGSILADHEEVEYVNYGPYEYHQNPYYHHNSYYRYDSYYYDRNPYYNHGVYSTGSYFDPHAAYHGAQEEGVGEHVPTGSVANPYDHGVHHGYHWSDEEGWHNGTHYGHE